MNDVKQNSQSHNQGNLTTTLKGAGKLEGKIETYSSEVQRAASSLKGDSSADERKKFANTVLSNGQKMADYLIEYATKDQ